ncbi:MAG TPA: tetratricopeptide repeat protein [Ktedonobacterales bacterium]|jgi:tetratricopeptide (TPR) repeat protein
MTNDLSTHLQAGISRFERGRYREALLAANALLAAAPEEPHAWGLRCDALTRLLRFDEAIEAATQVERFAPDNPQQLATALRHKGFALQRLKRYAEAVTAYRAALDCTPAGPDQTYAWTNLSACLLHLKRTPEALVASQCAIAVDATDPQAWLCHAGALEALGRRRQAVDALERAVALDPYHPDAALAWVGALLYLGRLRHAWRAFSEVRARWGGITTRRNERRYGPASLYTPRR